MQELAKLRKIIDRETPDAAKETLLVLDATTGQNGLQQAKVFRETAGLTGIILTKLDGTAKGGVVIAVARHLRRHRAGAWRAGEVRRPRRGHRRPAAL